MSVPTNRKDILLLLIYAPGKTRVVNEPIAGRTRLMKMLFLFMKEALPHFSKGIDISEANFYDFFPWNFGPFSSQVYEDLVFFKLTGFIESSAAPDEGLPESEEEWQKWLDQSGATESMEAISVYEEETFKLTPKGTEFARIMYESLSESQQNLLQSFKGRLADVPLRAILRYVYKRYPEQITRSQIAEEVSAY